MKDHFSVMYRNPGHWDIYTEPEGRIFCIRGRPGSFVIRDEQDCSGNSVVEKTTFPTVDAAMSWICATLMYEEKPCH